MPNPIDLLLNPTSDSNRGSTLKPDWVAQFLTSGLLNVDHLLEVVDGTPVWLSWVQNNNDPKQAAQIVVEQFSNINFDWMAPTRPAALKPVPRVASIFPYCTPENLELIFSNLPAQSLDVLRRLPQNSSNVSIECALEHKDSALVGLLVKWGWDIEAPDHNGQTMLLKTRKWQFAEILLDNGANVLAVDNNQTTILDRVGPWTSQARVDSGEIRKVLNTYINKASPSLNPIDEKKKNAITTLFGQIGEEKTGAIKKALEVLQKLNATSDELVDVAGRSLVQVLRDQVFKHGVYGYEQSHARFFSRFFTALINNHNPGGAVDLDRPFALNPVWSDRDVLMMMVLTLDTNASFNSGFLTAQMNEDLTDWKTNRYPHLVEHLHDFFAPLMDSSSSPERLREVLTAHLRSKNNQPFFAHIADDLAQLPFEHPMVQFVVQGLFEDHSKHRSTGFDEFDIKASEARWGHWYCQRNGLDNTHPLVGALDSQLMTMWSDWYVQNCGVVGEIGGYRSLQGGDTGLLSSFIQTRSEQLDQMDPQLLSSWRDFVLKEMSVVSLVELDTNHMDASVANLVHGVEAQVLHNVVTAHVGGCAVNSVKRKM